MSGKTVGYIRVSSFDQNVERQLDGIKCDKVFTDRASGKDVNRPKLLLAIEFLREDDTLIVHSMDRLARNLEPGESRHLDVEEKNVGAVLLERLQRFDAVLGLSADRELGPERRVVGERNHDCAGRYVGQRSIEVGVPLVCDTRGLFRERRRISRSR